MSYFYYLDLYLPFLLKALNQLEMWTQNSQDCLARLIASSILKFYFFMDGGVLL